MNNTVLKKAIDKVIGIVVATFSSSLQATSFYCIKTLLVLTALVVSTSTYATDQSSMSADKVWFKPKLIESNDTICEGLLVDATNKFLSSSSDLEFYDYYKLKNRGVRSINNLILLGGQEVAELKAYDKIFYLHAFRHPGCSGACEAYQSLVSTTPFTADEDRSALSKRAELAPPADSYDYLISQNESQIPYMLVYGIYGIAKQTLKVYKLSEQGQWNSACVISFRPDLNRITQQELNDAKAAIQRLEQATNQMRMSAGDCGRMYTHSRWAELLTDKLEQALYRPWAVKNSGAYRGNSHGLYEHTVENLKIWALTGMQASYAFDAYNKQLSESKQGLAKFYHHNFQWTEPYALKVAEEALTGAVAYGFGFYMYNTGFYEQEGELREAILNKAPIADIKKISIGFNSENDQCCADYSVKESLLNVAITYPEALQYLLEQGLDPNSKNVFGKTPLMYAAQYNQLESTAILLNKNADPNLSTIIPEDTCYYMLSKSGMRAIHYAARYAAPELIKLLIKNGAEPIVTTSEKTGGYPLDWLHKYTAANADEPNTNISANEIPILEKLLALPTAEEMTKLVLNLNASAEKAYAEKKLQEAYNLTQQALQLQPINERALSNLGLIAIKQGKTEIALEATRKLIDNGTDKKMVANAWYNYGMICDSTKKVYYNGNSYCSSSRIHNYLSSYLATPSEPRRKKLLEVINSSPKACHFKSGKVTLLADCGPTFWSNQICFIYPSGTNIDLSNLNGSYKTTNKTTKKFTITEEIPVYLNKASKAHSIGDNIFEIYYPKGTLNLPIKWDGETCNEDFSVSTQ